MGKEFVPDDVRLVIWELAHVEGGSVLLSQAVCNALGRDRHHVTDNIPLAVQLVPPGFEWLVRSDEERRGFANVSRSFEVPILGVRGACLDFGSKSYGSTPCLALCRAICKAHLEVFEKEKRGLSLVE